MGAGCLLMKEEMQYRLDLRFHPTIGRKRRFILKLTNFQYNQQQVQGCQAFGSIKSAFFTLGCPLGVSS